PARLLLSRHNLRLLAVDSVAIDNETESEQQRDQLIPAQPLLAIRLWGVGRRAVAAAVAPTRWTLHQRSASAAAAGRHFAYVARDDVNKYVCHVLDCLDPDDVGDPAAARRLCASPMPFASAVGGSCRCGGVGSSSSSVVKICACRWTPTRCCRRLRFPPRRRSPASASPACTWDACPWTALADSTALTTPSTPPLLKWPTVAARRRQSTLGCRRPVCDSNPATNAGSSTACGAVELRVRYLSFMGVSRASVRHARFHRADRARRFRVPRLPLRAQLRPALPHCGGRLQPALPEMPGLAGCHAWPRQPPAAAAQSGDESTAAGGGVKSDIVQAVTSLFSGLRRLSIK
uniref:PID domain-containing protein n=1 Tax=Macrostomum lignano TaxID=282301 RepID=A0A1I8F854_9PLAT